MKTLYVEFLLGHDTGLKESYNRAQEDELLQEYLKAVPELTILGGIRKSKSTSEPSTNKIRFQETDLKDSDRQILKARISFLEQTQLRLLSMEESNTKILGELAKILNNPAAISKTVQN